MAWIPTDGFIGSSECFIFVLSPGMECYKSIEDTKRNFLHVEKDKFMFGLGEYEMFISPRELRCNLFL